MADQPDDMLSEQIVLLSGKLLIMRDVLARLVAHVALHDSNPEEVLKGFFEMGDDRIDRGQPRNEADIRFRAALQKEKDWIVGAARKMAGLDEV